MMRKIFTKMTAFSLAAVMTVSITACGESIDLSCFAEAEGNYRIRGVEGYITAMDEKTVDVKIDPDYYDELPKANWADEDGMLYLQYELTEEGILLYNGGENTILVGIREVD